MDAQTPLLKASRYEQTTSFPLPNDPGQTITLPKRKPDRPDHIPPIQRPPSISSSTAAQKPKLKQVIAFCNEMGELGHKTARKAMSGALRKISPNSAAYFSRLKEKCARLLDSKANLTTTERRSLQKDVEVNLNYAQSRHDQIHGRDGLVDQLKNCAYALVEYRLYQDYGDYLAKNLNQLKQPPADKCELEGLLFKQSHLPWTEIAAHLARERAHEHAASDANLLREPLPPPHASSSPPGDVANPTTTASREWHDDLHKAVAIIGGPLTARQLAWEIEQYARRNATCHNGIDELIRDRRHYELGGKILRDLADLDRGFPPDRQADKLAWRAAIISLRDRFFTACTDAKGSGGFQTIIPNEEAWGGRGGGRSD